MASSLSDILSAVQNGVIALNNMAVQIKGSFNNILSRFVTDETNIAALQALVPIGHITNTLGADVAMNNIANYFPGPTVAQGTSGTWFASGSVVVLDTAGAASMAVRLWDGTTIIASARVTTANISFALCVTLSGVIISPTGNIRIDCNDSTSVNGVIKFNNSGDSKDSTLTVMRIG